MVTVNVAKQFTRYPAGRYMKNGETSGEAFRVRFLQGPLERREQVVVELDGTVGYGSSFLEEAFGGVVRQLRIPAATLLSLLTLKSTDPTIVDEITDYIRKAEQQLQ